VAPLEDFVGEYNSYEGVKYATTGTCARACPKRKIGKGDCAGLTLRDTARNVHKESTKAVEYEFGLQMPNRIMMGYSQQGYALVGEGACADSSGALTVSNTHYLKKKRDEGKLGRRRTLTSAEAGRDCAEECWQTGCPAFQYYKEDGKWRCNTYSEMPTIVDPQADRESKCYRTVRNWPLDIYQPWNSAWYMYMSDVNRVVALLEKDRDLNKASWTPGQNPLLDAVRDAYPEFCSKASDPELCPAPHEWSHSEAINMLLVMAPLSVSQMRALRQQVDSGTGDTAFGGSAKVKLRDLFRDVEWGEAWQRFLGQLNVEEVDNEDPDHPATLKADFAQKLQNIAAGSNLRMKDGVWDLLAAQDEYFKGL
jgi:hypothetical protein